MAPNKLSLLKGSQSRDDPMGPSHSSESGVATTTCTGTSSSTPDDNNSNKKMALSSRDRSLDCPSTAKARWASHRADSTSSDFGNLTTYEVVQSPGSTPLGASSTEMMDEEELAGRMSALDCTDRQELDYQEPSTSYDVSSRQLDDSDLESVSLSIISQSTIAAADDGAVANVAGSGNAPVKKETSKKQLRAERKELARRTKWEKRLNASDAQVLEHLLTSKGSVHAWRAEARARGLCSLSDGCRCADCQAGYLDPSGNDGDAGLGAGALMISDHLGHDMAPFCAIL